MPTNGLQPYQGLSGFFMPLMQQYITHIGRFMIVYIYDPLYTNEKVCECGVAINHILKAIESHHMLVIRSPKGEKIFFPENLKKHLKDFQTYEKVFKRPEEPMKMVTLPIPHCDYKPDEFYAVS